MAGSFRREHAWRKSSRSVGDGDCIEIAVVDSCVLVRDSKNQNGPVLIMKIALWEALIKAIKPGGRPARVRLSTSDDDYRYNLYTHILHRLGCCSSEPPAASAPASGKPNTDFSRGASRAN